jgi:hypothetical protein
MSLGIRVSQNKETHYAEEVELGYSSSLQACFRIDRSGKTPVGG